MENINDADFEKKVLKESIPVLIDFWAEWCMPCKMLAPVLDEIEKQYKGKVKIVKMNIDDNQDTPQKFSIISIPTMLIFKNGEMVENIVGMVPKSKIAEVLDKYL